MTGNMAKLTGKIQMEYQKAHPNDPAFKTAEALQRHHDYYVTLEREGELCEIDRPQFDLAMERERKGEVKPI